MGIDLGTSYSAVAVVQDGAPQVIPNEWGERTHASVVSFLDLIWERLPGLYPAPDRWSYRWRYRWSA